jgi:diguanylate cyclase
MEARADIDDRFEFRRAIDDGELRLHYQPVIDLRSRDVATAEALVRWQHPGRGLLGPDLFLQLAENICLGRALTSWVMRRATTDCADWRADGSPAGVSVNVQPDLLSEEWLVNEVIYSLQLSGLPAAALTIEITEHQWPTDPAPCYEMLAALSETGVRLSLDDFGTGDSSLSRLQHAQFNEVKIDRSFVVEAKDRCRDRDILRFTCGLAQALGMRAVAEGVEQTEDLQLVIELKADAAQGFLLGRPQPLAADSDW